MTTLEDIHDSWQSGDVDTDVLQLAHSDASSNSLRPLDYYREMSSMGGTDLMDTDAGIPSVGILAAIAAIAYVVMS